MLTVSLNEVETTALKATRGAGYAWGIAEEAGMACRWLAGHGLPFAGPLVSVLDAPTGERSGLSVGIALADDVANTLDRCPILVGQLRSPILIVPFIASMARRTGTELCLRWPEATVIAGGDGTVILDGEGLAAAVASVSIDRAPARGDQAPRAIEQVTTGVPAERAAWQALLDLSERTYVPESQASRTRGAGGGLTDED